MEENNKLDVNNDIEKQKELFKVIRRKKIYFWFMIIQIIILLAMHIYLFTYTGNHNHGLVVNPVISFNSRFEAYTNGRQTYAQIKSLVSHVIASNEEYKDEDIEVKVNGEKTNTVEEVMNNFSKNVLYTVDIKYSDDLGLVEDIIITEY